MITSGLILDWKDNEKVELLRDTISSELDYTNIFIEAARLHIHAGDDAGMLHSLKNATAHFKIAVGNANQLSRVRDAIKDSHAGRLAKIEAQITQ